MVQRVQLSTGMQECSKPDLQHGELCGWVHALAGNLQQDVCCSRLQLGVAALQQPGHQRHVPAWHGHSLATCNKHCRGNAACA